MSYREMAKELIDRIPESKMYYIVTFLQGAVVPEEIPNAETLESFAEIENGGGIRYPGASTKEFLQKLLEED